MVLSRATRRNQVALLDLEGGPPGSLPLVAGKIKRDRCCSRVPEANPCPCEEAAVPAPEVRVGAGGGLSLGLLLRARHARRVRRRRGRRLPHRRRRRRRRLGRLQRRRQRHVLRRQLLVCIGGGIAHPMPSRGMQQRRQPERTMHCVWIGRNGRLLQVIGLARMKGKKLT